uniref:Uncharacterized protein n=1 Tax=Triticum urartu TaxID=4572 RepID=A0A8R7TI87_TRIUA
PRPGSGLSPPHRPTSDALLPCGISCEMTIPSKSLLSLLASCSFNRYVALPTTCYILPLILPCQASNPPS